MTEHTKGQALRWARLFVLALASQPAAAALVATTAARWPLAAVFVGAAEVAVRSVARVLPVPFVVSIPATTSSAVPAAATSESKGN
jgi:hypothetical protein